MADTDRPKFVPGFNVQAPAVQMGPKNLHAASGWESPGLNVPTPAGWLPPDRAQALAFAAIDALTPTRSGVADALGTPVDMATWLARKLGAPVPGEWAPGGNAGLLDGILRPRSEAPPHTWRPAASVPFSSQFFNDALTGLPSWSDLYGVLSRRGGRPF